MSEGLNAERGILFCRGNGMSLPRDRVLYGEGYDRRVKKSKHPSPGSKDIPTELKSTI